MRIIAHLDMDAFFAAVEERDNGRFFGKPIVVGADPKEGKGRGVVATANYKARKYGIRSAMPISVAWKLSEKAKNEEKESVIFLLGNHKKYEQVSAEIMAILKKRIKLVEEASIDEAYLDLSLCKNFEEAEILCKKIKKEIKEKEKLTCSIGIGQNKLIAKIASDAKKPDGLTIVKIGEAEKFLENLSVRKIPGIGPKTEEFLNKQGAYKVSDLKKLSRKELADFLGKSGIELYDKIRGIDETPIVEFYKVKSIGEQETFEKDTLNFDYISQRLDFLCDNVIKKFKESKFKNYRTIVITVRFYDFETKTRSCTLKNAAFDKKTIYFEGLKLFAPFFDKRANLQKKPIRLIGIRIEKLN